MPDSNLIRIVSDLSASPAYSDRMKQLCTLALTFFLLPQIADSQRMHDGNVELARDLVERGEILPLAQVLDLLEKQHPGQVTEVELEYSDGILVYEVDLITNDGRLIEVDMNAATGNIVDIDEEDED